MCTHHRWRYVFGVRSMLALCNVSISMRWHVGTWCWIWSAMFKWYVSKCGLFDCNYVLSGIFCLYSLSLFYELFASLLASLISGGCHILPGWHDNHQIITRWHARNAHLSRLGVMLLSLSFVYLTISILLLFCHLLFVFCHILLHYSDQLATYRHFSTCQHVTSQFILA